MDSYTNDVFQLTNIIYKLYSQFLEIEVLAEMWTWEVVAGRSRKPVKKAMNAESNFTTVIDFSWALKDKPMYAVRRPFLNTGFTFP